MVHPHDSTKITIEDLVRPDKRMISGMFMVSIDL